MKKIMALILVVAMAVSMLAACGGEAAPKETQAKTDAPKETQAGAATSEEPYNIVIEMLYFGMEDPDMQEVLDAINAITLPAINATVSFMPTSFPEMATKPGLWHSSGDKVDVLMTGMMTDPQQLAEQGLLYPLDELLANSPTLTELAGDLLLACRYDGVTYAYPLDLYPGNGQAYFYDLELAEQYGITFPESIETEADLADVFAQIKASGMTQYANTYSNGILAFQNYGYDIENFGDNYCARGIIFNGEDGMEVVNWYASDTYKEMCELHRQWYLDGYIIPDALTNDYTYLDSMSQGTLFGFVSSEGASVGKAYHESQTGRKLGMVPMGDTVIRGVDVSVNTWGIASNCENPQKVIEFMELLYTDAELANLFNYGIEGKHYVKQEGSQLIDYPEGVNSFTNGYGTSVTTGSLGDRKLLYAKSENWTEEMLASIDNYGLAGGVVSPYMSFNYNMSNVTTENAAVMAVIQKYAPSLNCGVVDVEETLPKFIEELETAGIGKIIEDTQAQIDAWAASK